ncbi:MAG: SPFH domain-containing protein [Acidobacteriota bacterium]
MEKYGTEAAVFVFFVVPLVFFILLIAIAKRYKKVGPNEVMIISGRKHKMQNADGSSETTGFRIRTGGGAFIFPLLERVDLLSLQVMTLDITTPEVYTKPGVPVVVEAVAQVKIKGDEASIRTAAEQCLGKSIPEIKDIARQTVEGHLRAIIGTLTVEEIYRNRDQFASSVQEVAVADLQNMGLQVVSFTLKDIRDTHGYLDALGKPKIAEIKRDAIIAQAEADRDANIKSSQARQLGDVAKFAADTQIAAAQRDFETQKAQYDGAVNLKRAEADLAYDIQKAKTSQELKKEEIQVSIVEKEQQITVQEREIQRREKELEATVKRQADAERYKVETEAAAFRARVEQEAKGQAEATRAKGQAQAEVLRVTGTAEAEIIALKGTAEAEAMKKRADSFKEYNQAAVLQLLIASLPEIARAVAEPLGKTDRITLVSTGGEGIGASKITGDIAKVIAELPAVIEGLSGIDLRKLMAQIPALKNVTTQKTDGES